MLSKFIETIFKEPVLMVTFIRVLFTYYIYNIFILFILYFESLKFLALIIL